MTNGFNDPTIEKNVLPSTALTFNLENSCSRFFGSLSPLDLEFDFAAFLD